MLRWYVGGVAVAKRKRRNFSKIIASQARLVEEQEKALKAIEPRAREAVARAKAVRVKADASERLASEVLRESGYRGT